MFKFQLAFLLRNKYLLMFIIYSGAQKRSQRRRIFMGQGGVSKGLLPVVISPSSISFFQKQKK